MDKLGAALHYLDQKICRKDGVGLLLEVHRVRKRVFHTKFTTEKTGQNEKKSFP